MIESTVHEFEILYSKRVRQREKKWEDGKLKFYEFNNKLEVYSDAGLLVTSDFYPTEVKLVMSSGVFEKGKSYIFPNGDLIIETINYERSYTRNLTDVLMKSGTSRARVTRRNTPLGNTRKVAKKDAQIPRIRKESALNPLSMVITADQAKSCLNAWDQAVNRSMIRISPESNRFSQLMRPKGKQNLRIVNSYSKNSLKSKINM